MSFAQQRLWFIAQLEGPSPVYNNPLALRLDGDLDIAALEAALADVITRHEVLRTVLPAEGGQPYQRVLGLAELGWQLPVMPVAEADLAETVARIAAEPFDLPVQVPVRARLLAAGPAGACAGAGDPSHRDRWLVDWDLWPGIWVPRTRPGGRAGRRGGRRCRCSTPTTRSGSGTCSATRLTPASLLAAAGGLVAARRWPGRRRSWRCRPTGRARRCRVTAGMRCRSTFRLRCTGGWRGWPGPRA